MREIVTLQLGHSSSFVGTHLWNALDAETGDHVDPNVMFRSGNDAEKGVATYAPRLVIVDLKGSLGSLKTISKLYDSSEIDERNATAWNGKVDVQKQDPYSKNEYLTHLESEEGADLNEPVFQKKPFSKILDSSVTVWSDFNSMFYHPRTVVELLQYSHNDETSPFALYDQGSELWLADKVLQDDILENRVRFFLEECDNPQGIQVLADVSNAFSGFTASCLDSLREDVGKMIITVNGISNESDHIAEPVRKFNEAMTLGQITESASLYVPIKKPTGNFCGFQSGKFKMRSTLNSRYQWSACIAASLDTLTIPTRLAQSPTTMASLFGPITSTGPLGMLAASFPLPFESIQPLKELLGKKLLLEDHIDWIHDFTFDLPYDLIERISGQTSVLRGVESATSADLISTLGEFLSLNPAPIGCNSSYTSKKPFPISLAFPDVFSSPLVSKSAIPVFARLRSASRLSSLASESILNLQNLPGKFKRMRELNMNTSQEYIESVTDRLASLQVIYEDS